MFFCLKTSKHPQNTTNANNAVIPGQDQGSCLKNSTRPAIKQTKKHAHLMFLQKTKVEACMNSIEDA